MNNLFKTIAIGLGIAALAVLFLLVGIQSNTFLLICALFAGLLFIGYKLPVFYTREQIDALPMHVRVLLLVGAGVAYYLLFRVVFR